MIIGVPREVKPGEQRVALTPAGGAVGGWIKDVVAGRPDARPALDSLPAPGNLLVVSEQGLWVVS